MAAENEGGEGLRRATGTQLRRLKDGLFEVALLGATLVGIVSLLVLFGYITFDAFRPLTASAQWYLLYFGTLVTPTAAFTWYARRDPAVRAANAKSFAVVFGGLAVSLVTYVVADSVSPHDVLVFLLFGAVPPLLVGVYARVTDERTYTGPVIPVAAVLGLAVAALFYDVLRPVAGIADEWVAYVGIATLPVAGILGLVSARRWSPRRGVIAATAVVLSTLFVAGGLLGAGVDPSFWVVLFSAFVVPVGYVVGSTVATESDGRIGVLGPFVLLGGVFAGAALERQLAIQGLESFLTPSLLLNSWDGLNASNAGVYPQIVGSIVIVGFMALLAFPVGISAAVYLEEYAPNSGWGGRLATLLEVNISNLAGVPSVVYGLLGLALFRNTLGFGTGITASAAGTLGLLILPIVVVSAQEAIRAVPDSLREASYGMGASRWQTLRNVVFPEAVPGILTGTILALARAIGETAPLVIIAVATTTYSPPEGLFSSATALPLQIFAARSSAMPEFRHGVVPATAVVLLVLMLLMNATAIVVRNRYDREINQ
ncbi:phosphate ABC transporter permease PstA [Halorussus halobius]|uniref:phosphate ABC transporter permease PstA n=1 Tax=Halorussus halobius TaxID=1710537 RepID=UPI0010926553|nr:phosphate ABC transporter permease PstA [Halorussus halobius]